MRNFAAILVLTAVAACTDASSDSGEPVPTHLVEHPAFEGVEFPMAVGHGGAKELCPENTLECYQMALDAGASALEADLQVLGDGSLVMFHDDNALEQTGVDADLRSLTLAQMREFDLGHGFSPDEGGSYPYRGMGFSVSTLAEFLAAFRGVPVLLDVKPEIPEMAAALVAFARDELDADDRLRLYIKSNDQEVADALRSLDPRPRVALSSDERTLLVLALLGGDEPELGDVGPSWVDLDTDIPGFATILSDAAAWTQREGHVLSASTVNDPDSLTELSTGGDVDGIVTDRPDLFAPPSP